MPWWRQNKGLTYFRIYYIKEIWQKCWGRFNHLKPAFWAIQAFHLKHMQPLTLTSPLFRIFCPNASKRLLKAIFFRKHLVKFAGLAYKQKAALSVNTGVAVEFLTNNIMSSNRRTPVSGGAGGRGRGITRKLLSYWIWVSIQRNAASTCYLQANHNWVGKKCLLRGRKRRWPVSDLSASREKAKNRHSGWN